MTDESISSEHRSTIRVRKTGTYFLQETAHVDRNGPGSTAGGWHGFLDRRGGRPAGALFGVQIVYTKQDSNIIICPLCHKTLSISTACIRHYNGSDTWVHADCALASEEALAKLWDTPEEDRAWSNLV